ncbi:heterogeneous nuclear ribonucleoprotein U-like protein 2 [Brienomyrus brachyistius]|uniref:heterogeneous nuclear ribonucleoprotein U-like protein 2 n=1 Tax=Brienomyrus brachyistius TaxID=42636 RepID=UPI0020B21F66|nr:heterogeneous nuclear ribonucleoprotein U-like protein 2 [Brienomyrus brachyistius]
MNLAEIKKLKVADLRAKLQERGLDSKGLKADLVERLMSAIEAESQGSATGETEDEKRPVGEDEGMETQGDSVMDLPALAVETAAETTQQLPTGVAEVSPTVKANEGFTEVGGLAMPGSGISEELTSTGAPGAAILKADFPASSVLGQEKVSQQISVESSHTKPAHTGVASESPLKASPEQGLFPVPAKDHEKKPEQESESDGALVESSPPEHIRREQQRSSDQPELQPTAFNQAAGPRTGVTASPGSEPPCPEVEDGDEPAGVECAESCSGVEEEEGLNGGAGRRGEDAEAEKGSEEETGSEPEKGEQQSRSADSQGAETAGSHTESRGQKRPHGERGRGYYEFKEEINYNRAKSPEPEPELEEEVDEGVVRLDTYNCDLHFEVSPDGSTGQPLLSEKFPLLWSGCRLTHGVDQGKVGFEAKYVKKLPVTGLNLEESDTHVLRVGWSVDNSSFQLGQVEFSYCYDGRGRKVTEGKEEEFGEPLSENDVIGCYAAFLDSDVELSFHKNGDPLGVAFRLCRTTLDGRALFPHVLCRNCSVSLEINSSGSPWYPSPAGFTPISSLPPELRVRAPLPPVSKRDCEVLMMVGMPGAGKTHWAQTHIAQHPEKRYNLLGTRTVLGNMRSVPNPAQKDQILQQATQCLSELIRIAARRRRNYILDQANVYSSAQRRKMQRFSGFQRRAVVVCPKDEEWRRRLELHQQQEGEEVPEMSLLKVKVSFSLPEQGDYLEEVLFPELTRSEAEKLLAGYKEEARRLLPTPPKRKKPRTWRNKPLPSGPPGRNHRDWGHGWNRGSYNPRPYGQQPFWGPQRREDFRPFYGQQRTDVDRFYGREYNPQRYRDYYRQYSGEWNSYYQDQGYYGNRNYGYGGRRGHW